MQLLAEVSDQSETVVTRTVDDTVHLTDKAVAALNPGSDWRSDWLRAKAVVLAATSADL